MTSTLITGANKGLGRETARRLLADGHDVWLAARDPELGRAAAEELGGRFVQLDVTDQESVRAAAELVAAETHSLDVLINNAAITGATKPVEDVTGEDVGRVFDTNVLGEPCDRRRFERHGLTGSDHGSGSSGVELDQPRLPRLQERGIKTVEQGAEIIVRMARLDGSGPTGTFLDADGPVPW